MNDVTPLRLGIVPYFNVLPLLEGLESTFPSEGWVRATPRQLAAMLAARELDLAIVSSFEGLFRGYDLIPGAVIGSDGPVRSVALCSKVPLLQVRRVLLDCSSLSSIALLRVLCCELLSIQPEFTLSEEPLRCDFPWQTMEQDALLVIGDTALAWEHAFPYRLDLGEAWKSLTGLPFVFAGWWVRHGVELAPRQIEAFGAARGRGLRQIENILDRLTPEEMALGGGRSSLEHYLRHAIAYDLGEKTLASLELFRLKLHRHGLLDGAPDQPVRYHGGHAIVPALDA